MRENCKRNKRERLIENCPQVASGMNSQSTKINAYKKGNRLDREERQKEGFRPHHCLPILARLDTEIKVSSC